MGRQIEELAKFVATVTWDDVPDPVRYHTKMVLLDTLGVILAGSARPEVKQLRERLAGGAGATVFASGWPSSDVRTAALLNGIAGRSIELCEGLRFVSGQAAMQVLPGALAVGEQTGATGRDMLMALLLGYDVAARLAEGFTPRPLAHQNGQVSLLASAAAGARLRGLDAAGINRAMGIATTLLLTPSYTNAVAGATALNVAGGMSGFAAALAPDLALAGFEPQEDAIELALGQLVGDGFRTDGVLDELGKTWHITQNYFRLYACCNPIHPALDCLVAALAELKARPEEIVRIECVTYRFASVMRDPNPRNYFASKYSFPHAAATLAVRGSAGFAALDDTAVHDPFITALRQRVTVAEDPAMTALAPRLRPARVTVELKDGRRATHDRDSHRGDFQDPFSEAELREKFRELAVVVLTRKGATLVEQAVDRCEEWDDVGVLTTLCRANGRA
ncbi:MmgE/PrpD family protein [Acidisphaera sp. S103]|uniref:MmgE/PrpD family protein n=1 Tax=Acidisphaera sp. S103 TaxID=1747223 RepID=UPI00131EA5B7|nr:MmgE/PrpD family protein [Acidisphaera sp. S103]